MPQHWIEKYKHKVKDAFGQTEKQSIEKPMKVEASKPLTPQRHLRPRGPMRSVVDAQIREQDQARRAQIEQRKNEIQAKLEQDRLKERTRGR